jgi:hypothetical protein
VSRRELGLCNIGGVLVSFVSGSSCNLALVARSKFSEITVIVTLPADKS